MNEFIDGMHKVGESMAAVVSAQSTKDAQDRMKAENATKQAPPPPRP